MTETVETGLYTGLPSIGAPFLWPEEFTPQVKALWESIQVVLLTDVPDGVRMEDEP